MRYKSLPFKDKMDELFSDVVATRADALCPNFGVLPSFAGDLSDNDLGLEDQAMEGDGLDANSNSNNDHPQPVDGCGGQATELVQAQANQLDHRTRGRGRDRKTDEKQRVVGVIGMRMSRL